MGTKSLAQIPRIEEFFDPEDANASCLRLVRHLSEDWKLDDSQIKLRPFEEGITNTIMKVTPLRNGKADADAEQESVLIRAYGRDTEFMIDRSKELRAHHMLAAKDLAAPILATFQNGFICGFIPGEICEAEDFHTPQIYREIAKRLGQWHGSLPIDDLIEGTGPGGKPYPNIWTNCSKWIDLLPSKTDEQASQNELFKGELAWLEDLFGDIPGLNGNDFVFSHTDLLCANVVLQPQVDGQPRQAFFIDYEYATTAPPAFDVANFFAEWAGPDGDLSFMPSKSHRLDFIRQYVRSFRQNADVDSSDLLQEQKSATQIYTQVDLLRGLPGFYWGIWGLIQASISEIDFDYPAYAKRRHSEYWSWKEEYDGSREKAGREMTIREQKWARE